MSPTGSGPARPLNVTRRGTALITGASSGLGTEFAWQLAASGHDLVIVARREDRLAQLQNDLEQVAGVNVEVIVADLATADGRATVVARLRADSAPIGLLVNNAGFGLGQRFIGGSLGRENDAIEVMIRAVMEFSHAAATAMIPRGRGAILNVSSMVAQTAMGTYAAAKAWVRTFTEALAGELAGTGVTATAVSPGLVRTEFHSASGMKESVWPEFGWLDAEDVVADALSAVRRGVVHTTPSLRYKSLQGIMKLAPRSLVRKLGGPQMWERAIRDESGKMSLADLYDAEGLEQSAAERAVFSRIHAADPAEGSWLKNTVGAGFGLTPANLLGRDFDRYVQVRFAIERAWVCGKDNHTWLGETPPWKDPCLDVADEHPLSGNPADWEQTYERCGLNRAQWVALGDYLSAARAQLTVGYWEGYGGFTASDGRPALIGRVRSYFGGQSPRSRAMLTRILEGGDGDNSAEWEAQWAAGTRAAALGELPRALREGAKLDLPDRSHVLLTFDDWDALSAYVGREHSGTWYPNLMWPADRRWALAMDVDSGSVIIGCDADLADGLVVDDRLYAEDIGVDETALGAIDPGDPERDPMVEEDDLD